MIRIICIFFMCLYLCTCENNTQAAKKNTVEQGTQQFIARNRGSIEGNQDDNSHQTTEPDANACSCSKIYDPVCATNGRSYYNMCQMECDVGGGSNVTVAHQGNCIPF